jgi:hypothetical protein
MLSIKKALSALSENWQLWLLYNIEVCKWSTTEPLDPATFQAPIFNQVQSDWLISKVPSNAQAAASTAALGAVSAIPAQKAMPRFTSFTSSITTSIKKLLAKLLGWSFCLCCGCSSHCTDKCTNTTRLDNSPLFISNKFMDPKPAYCTVSNGGNS